jgi:hypothetical protein
VNTSALFSPPHRWEPAAWTEPDDAGGLSFDRNLPAVRQSASWTCSAASLAWVMNALGVPAPTPGLWDEWDGVNEIRRINGPGAVSPDYGLAYASGVGVEAVYVEYGFVVVRQEVTWAELAYLCELGIGQLGGGRLYHWLGVRGYNGRQFDLANPAYSWKGIADDLDAREWNAWGAWNYVGIVGVQ